MVDGNSSVGNGLIRFASQRAFSAHLILWLESANLRKSRLIPIFTAISAGVVEGEIPLDLCYEEDSHADVDFNVVMTSERQFIEVQGDLDESNLPRSQL